MAVPANYNPIIDPAKKLMATPTPGMTPFYSIPEESDQVGTHLHMRVFYTVSGDSSIINASLCVTCIHHVLSCMYKIHLHLSARALSHARARAHTHTHTHTHIHTHLTFLLQLRKDMPDVPEGLPDMKPEDMQYFSKLLQVWLVKPSCVCFSLFVSACHVRPNVQRALGL
jgi:splicing factor 3B subunit 1